jgi:hypothetical protein
MSVLRIKMPESAMSPTSALIPNGCRNKSRRDLEWGGRPEDNQRDPNARFRCEAVGGGLTEPHLERLALGVVPGQDDDFGERRIRKLVRQREEKARRTGRPV